MSVMDFVGEFYEPERERPHLNSLDARYRGGISAEVSGPEITTAIAAAILPEDYEKAFFTDTPRRMLARLLLAASASPTSCSG